MTAAGKVFIRRRDGRMYALTPAKIRSCPLDVPSVKARITTEEIVEMIRSGRERGCAWDGQGSVYALHYPHSRQNTCRE